MVIALLTTDNRENFRQYSKDAPFFGTAPEALMQGFAAHRDIMVHVLSCTQQPMKSPDKLAPNIHFHSLHVPKRGWGRTAYQGCVRATRRKLAEIGPDIVHGQGTERDCAISAVRSGFPNVITIHGNMRLIAKVNGAAPLTYQWIAARLERYTIPRSGGVVCITDYTRRAVADLARRTWVVPNAVDQFFFDIPRQPGTKAVLLCVGNIQHRKNQVSFIKALDPVAKETPLHVEFAGAADERDQYTQEFLSLISTRPWCSFYGSLDRAALKERLATATALALPSLEDNCPMVVLEAMAAGVPVMAANVGGVPELIADGKTGLLCDPLNEQSMRNRTVELLTNSGLREKLSANGKRAALDRFHPKTIAGRHLEIYRELPGSRS